MEKSINKIIHSIGSIESLIVHTIAFILSFLLCLFGVNFDRVLLVLTTAVSLEAIYLSLLIQISVNMQSKQVLELQKDVQEIQEDVNEIQEDVEEIEEGPF